MTAQPQKLLVSMDWKGVTHTVGTLSIYVVRGQEHYQFSYAAAWAQESSRFPIDPALELVPGAVYTANRLWGAFQDISPDRWGRLVQSRVYNKHLSASDYMLGVSDYMRMGALRLSLVDSAEVYLADHKEIPKLIHLRALEDAVARLERGQETDPDLALLAHGSSLGGAHPKASVEDKGRLWIAKFQSHTDTERISCLEATMLSLAHQAGIETATHRLLNSKTNRPILLVQRFDRTETGQRIAFASAMTMLERHDQDATKASYLELSEAITRFSAHPQEDRYELWKRMTFNAMAGNIDDHLRNHGFLREAQGWRLSPAYDLNPTRETFEKRAHCLSFDGEQSRPSLDLCIILADYFGLSKAQIESALLKLAKSLANWQHTAKRHGLQGDEIERMKASFEHSDKHKLEEYLAKRAKNVAKHRTHHNDPEIEL